MKDAITRFSENDMELDGRINGEDDENTPYGEIGSVASKEMVRTTHSHSLLFLYMFFLPRSVYLQCLQSYTSPEYGIFPPLTIGHAMRN